KDVDPDALIRAIRSVHDGHTVLAPEAAGLVTARPAGHARGIGALTGRGRDVLELLAAGHSNREIARTLRVSEKTVKTHVSAVLAKLGVADRTQAALLAVRHRGRAELAPCAVPSPSAGAVPGRSTGTARGGGCGGGAMP